MNKLILIGILVLGVIILIFVFKGNTPTPLSTKPLLSEEGKAISQKALLFSLKDYQGNTVSSSNFQGKPLVINSWAVWCPFCKKELEDFANVQKEFNDKVVIIAIDRAESLETAKRFTDEAGISNALIFLLDPQDSFYKSIGGFSMPETIFVDKNGVTKSHKRGPMDIQEMRERIKEIL